MTTMASGPYRTSCPFLIAIPTDWRLRAPPVGCEPPTSISPPTDIPAPGITGTDESSSMELCVDESELFEFGSLTIDSWMIPSEQDFFL